jgi:hypothetical protein
MAKSLLSEIRTAVCEFDKYKIGTLSLFLNSVMNLASVPNNDIPGCLSEYKTGGAVKTKKAQKKEQTKERMWEVSNIAKKPVGFER